MIQNNSKLATCPFLNILPQRGNVIYEIKVEIFKTQKIFKQCNLVLVDNRRAINFQVLWDVPGSEDGSNSNLRAHAKGWKSWKATSLGALWFCLYIKEYSNLLNCFFSNEEEMRPNIQADPQGMEGKRSPRGHSIHQSSISVSISF